MILSETAYHLMKEALEEIATAPANTNAGDLMSKARHALTRTIQEEDYLIAEEEMEDFDEDDDLGGPLEYRQEDACSLDDECESCQ